MRPEDASNPDPSDLLKKAIENYLEFRTHAGQDRNIAERNLTKWILLGNAPPDQIQDELKSIATQLDLKALGAGPILISLNLVTPEGVDWLVENWIPCGKMTLFSGDPKIGKSQVALSFIAACSRGRPWPDANGVPTKLCSSIILSAEDGVEDTIVPRLEAMDADLSKIKVLTAVRAQVGGKGEITQQSFSAEEHSAFLEMAIAKMGDVGIVLFDPISAYGGSTDTNSNHEVRRILDRLQALAARHKIAIVSVSHLNKNSGAKAIYRSIGSLAYTAVCRMLLTLAKDRDNPARRILLREGNLIPVKMPGLAFTISSVEGTTVGKLVWESGSVDMTPDDALREESDADRHESALEFAVRWLRERLATGPVESNEVVEDAQSEEISERTLERAKKDVGVRSKRRGSGDTSKWFWELPGGVESPPDPTRGAHADSGGGVGGDGSLGGVEEKERENGALRGEENRQERQGSQDRQAESLEGEDRQERQVRQRRQGSQERHASPPPMSATVGGNSTRGRQRGFFPQRSLSSTTTARRSSAMRDPYLVTDVRMVEASPAEIRQGMLGFISCTIGSRVRLDGLTLRRSKVGRLYVAFPKTTDAQGRVHQNVRPLNAISRRDIEAQIFRALGIHLEVAP